MLIYVLYQRILRWRWRRDHGPMNYVLEARTGDRGRQARTSPLPCSSASFVSVYPPFTAETSQATDDRSASDTLRSENPRGRVRGAWSCLEGRLTLCPPLLSRPVSMSIRIHRWIPIWSRPFHATASYSGLILTGAPLIIVASLLAPLVANHKFRH